MVQQEEFGGSFPDPHGEATTTSSPSIFRIRGLTTGVAAVETAGSEDNDGYTTDNSLYFTTGGPEPAFGFGGNTTTDDEESLTYSQKVALEERRVLSEYQMEDPGANSGNSVVTPRKEGSNGASGNKASSSPSAGLGRHVVWAGSVAGGSSTGGSASGSMSNNSYDGILDKLRTFALASRGCRGAGSSPASTPEKTGLNSTMDTSGAAYDESIVGEDDFSYVEKIDAATGPPNIPPTTIMVKSKNGKGGYESVGYVHGADGSCASKFLRPRRIVWALGLLMFAAIAVALGGWVAAEKTSSSSKSVADGAGTGTSTSSKVTLPPSVTGIRSPTAAPVPAATTPPKEDTATSPPTDGDTDIFARPLDSLTSSPTAAPTQSPTTAPPTERPVAGPTGTPTTAPIAPTESPTEACVPVDDSTAQVFISVKVGLASCSWLAQNPGPRRRVCNPGFEPWDVCRKTCNSGCPTTAVVPAPTQAPTAASTRAPVAAPTLTPVAAPTKAPVETPTAAPVKPPTVAPVTPPTVSPTAAPVETPTSSPTARATPALTLSLQMEIRSILLKASPGSLKFLKDANSPQAKAAAWIEGQQKNGSVNLQTMSDEMIAQSWAVAAFALGLDVERWSINTGWLDQVGNECNWVGIRCDARNRVVSIQLMRNDLDGELLPELWLLSDTLTTLDLSRNSIRGGIPGEYGRLGKLKQLELDRNLMDGDIETQIGRMTSLETLKLEYNFMIGPLPQELTNLNKLKTFTFFSNSFTGTVPGGLCNLGSLATLEADCRETTCACCTRCWYQCGGNTGVPCN